MRTNCILSASLRGTLINRKESISAVGIAVEEEEDVAVGVGGGTLEVFAFPAKVGGASRGLPSNLTRKVDHEDSGTTDMGPVIAVEVAAAVVVVGA